MFWHVSGAAVLMKLGIDCEDGGKMVIRIQPPNGWSAAYCCLQYTEAEQT